MLEIQNK
jgi:importin-5